MYNFIDKETGNVKIGVLVIGKDTKWDDLRKLSDYAKEVDIDDESGLWAWNTLLVHNDVEVDVHLYMRNPKRYSQVVLPRLKLSLVNPDKNIMAAERGMVAKVIFPYYAKWLHEELGEATKETENIIEYSYDWGTVRCECMWVAREQEYYTQHIEITYKEQ